MSTYFDDIEGVWKRCLPHLQSESLCTLSYVQPAGGPSSAMVAFVSLTESPLILIHSMSYARKADCLGEGSAVAVSVGSARDLTRTTQIEGTVSPTREPRHRHLLIRLSREKQSPLTADFLFDRHSLVFIIRPTWIRLSEYPSGSEARVLESEASPSLPGLSLSQPAPRPNDLTLF